MTAVIDNGNGTDSLRSVGASGGGLATFARPADTNAYAALDAVANSTTASAVTILTFASMGARPGGSGFITKAKLQTDQSTCVARFRLHLFNSATPTIPADNAAFTHKFADASLYLGCIDFDACRTEGAGSDGAYSLNTTIRLHFTCGAALTSLFGLLETIDVFTPASGQNFRIALATDEY